MKLPELLAPAADAAVAEAAFEHGADAVYAGLDQCNLRVHSPGIPVSSLEETIARARDHGKKMYVALNAMPDDRMLDNLDGLLGRLAGARHLPDAFIVSDPGVLDICRRCFPIVDLHLSTQTGVFNRAAMAFWAGQGIRRVILPRELTLEQIASLSGTGLCETEIFIHGAMCVSVSGRCLLSAYLQGRHANFGDCAQPCRLKYSIRPENDAGKEAYQEVDIDEDKGEAYILNSKDLNVLPILKKVVESGVSSLKIEGRTKSVHYVSAVVKVYRAALDRYAENPGGFMVDPAWIDELDRIDHRPYTTGFYAGDYGMQSVFSNKCSSLVRVLGIVRETGHGGVVIDVKNPFCAGETVNVLPVKKGAEPYEYVIPAIHDIRGNPLDRALTNRLVVVENRPVLKPGDILRKISAKQAAPPSGNSSISNAR